MPLRAALHPAEPAATFAGFRLALWCLPGLYGRAGLADKPNPRRAIKPGKNVFRSIFRSIISKKGRHQAGENLQVIVMQ